MATLETALKKLLKDITAFTRHAGGLQLRGYQRAVASAIVRSVLTGAGHSFVVIFPRQSGKNELQAQLQTYLLTLFSGARADIVQISPTYKPQTTNAMARLEGTLSANLLTRERWERQYGHVYRVGGARVTFLSGSPTANIVGATASTLLSIDEAQDILIDKYDKEIAPMAASTNATRVFWGTAWTAETLLAREERAARRLEAKDGLRRVWRLTCEDVAQEVPAYGAFAAEQVARLGRSHPMVRTQYYSEDIDGQGGMFPPERIDLLRGTHQPHGAPQPGCLYVMALDIAGADEAHAGYASSSSAGTGRDATALTIARVDLGEIAAGRATAPVYEVVFRRLWEGVKHATLYPQILELANRWGARRLVCDATGIGAGLTSFLVKALGGRVVPFTFSVKSKSDLAWSFLSLVDSGRFKEYTTGVEGLDELAQLQALFYEQLAYCEYQIAPGPDKRIAWGVPANARSTTNGERVHDDLVISAALLSTLDGESWSLPGLTEIVKAADPLDSMKGF